MSAKPFIKTREVILCCPHAAYWTAMTPELKDRFFIPRWSLPRLKRHLDMLKAFGFNAIQIVAVPQLGLNAGVEESQCESKLVFLAQTAREMGMSVALFQWGSYTYEDAMRKYGKGPGRQKMDVTEILSGGLDWHKPSDRSRFEQEYRRLIGFAPHVDRVVTHWIDPGGPKRGCAQCTIETAIEMHNRIAAYWGEANPKIEVYFSNWLLAPGELAPVNPNHPRWAGYEGVQTLLNSPTLDKASGIAFGVNNQLSDGQYLSLDARLDAADLRAVAQAGRKAGVWCWYTGEIETAPAMHVHTGVLQNYFRSLPKEAHDLLEWHDVEETCQGLSMHNMFMAARLMRDPSLDARELLNEFVTGLVGDSATSAVVAGLDALELARCVSCTYAFDVALPGKQTQGRALDQNWLTDTAKKVDDAIARTDRLSITDQPTPWPVTMPATEYVDELKAHLRSVKDMMPFLREAWKLRQQAAGGASKEELAAAMKALPTVTYDPAHTAGLENAAYQIKLKALRERFGLTK